jgi:mannose-1-phosphate guanylyltransferase
MMAVLLAAGLGTRLRPLTDTTPKCLVRVAGRTLLDIWLDALAAAGVAEVLVNTHHLSEQVDLHLAGRKGEPPRVRTAHEPRLLGSAGTLSANRHTLERNEMFLAVNADNLTDFDLSILIDAHRARGCTATVTVFRSQAPTECGIVEVHDGLVIGFEEKPPKPNGNLANAGMYAFHPDVLNLVEGPPPRDIGYDLLPKLVGRARVVSLEDAFFMDIGTHEALERAQLEWQGGATQ